MSNDKSKSEGTFEFVVENFTELNHSISVCSPPYMICNFPWRISVRKFSEKPDDPPSKQSLAIFLQVLIRCNNESSSSWCCIANIDLVIVSQKKSVKNFKKTFRNFFHSKATSCGYNVIKSWSDVINPQHGFIKNNKVILRAHVIVDNTPRSVSWGSLGLENQKYNVTAMEFNTIKDDDKSEATFDLILENIRKLKDSPCVSLPCMIRSLPWKMSVNRKYENSVDSPSQEMFGIFLHCDNKSQNSWSCSAKIKVMILSLTDGICDFVKEFQHSFCFLRSNHGYRMFKLWNDVIDQKSGFIRNDIIVLRVHVSADVPNAGYVGLVNQQDTGFLNSVLQTLYFVSQFRKAVYKLPLEGDDNNENFTSVLQRIFYELQTTEKTVSIKNLTRFLRYEGLDLFPPHNMSEFLKIFFDKLENKMKGTTVEGTIRNLFESKTEHFLKCSDIDSKCKKTESFYSIKLNIEKSDINESFKDYIVTEVLEENRKYEAGDQSFQGAQKGVIFESLPSVLLIHLNRFDYHYSSGCYEKCNKKFVFYEKIDLNKYLKNPGPTTANYTLFAVLAHSGSCHGGQYVVFVSPNGDGIWYQFHDEVVSICPRKEAIENNFGNSVENSRCAYMLVYVRDSMSEHVLSKVANDDIPSALKLRLEEESEEPQIKRAKREEHLTIRVVLEDCFDGHQGPDLFDSAQIPDLSDKVETLIRVFEVKRSTTVEEILIMFSKSFGHSLNQIRIWPFAEKPNQSYRPMYFDASAERGKKIRDIVTNTYWNVFLEIFPADLGDYPLPMFDDESTVLLFFKCYDPKIQKIYYCEHAYFNVDSIFDKLIRKLNEKAGYPPDTKLIMYKEVKARMLQKIVPSSGPLKMVLKELANGDIIVFQKENLTIGLTEVEKHYIHL